MRSPRLKAGRNPLQFGRLWVLGVALALCRWLKMLGFDKEIMRYCYHFKEMVSLV